MSDTPEIAGAKRKLELQATELPNWARQLLDYIAGLEGGRTFSDGIEAARVALGKRALEVDDEAEKLDEDDERGEQLEAIAHAFGVLDEDLLALALTEGTLGRGG
jgi:hypothetical protein